MVPGGILAILLGTVIGLTPNTPADQVVGVLMVIGGLALLAYRRGARQ